MTQAQKVRSISDNKQLQSKNQYNLQSHNNSTHQSSTQQQPQKEYNNQSIFQAKQQKSQKDQQQSSSQYIPKSSIPSKKILTYIKNKKTIQPKKSTYLQSGIIGKPITSEEQNRKNLLNNQSSALIQQMNNLTNQDRYDNSNQGINELLIQNNLQSLSNKLVPFQQQQEYQSGQFLRGNQEAQNQILQAGQEQISKLQNQQNQLNNYQRPSSSIYNQKYLLKQLNQNQNNQNQKYNSNKNYNKKNGLNINQQSIDNFKKQKNKELTIIDSQRSRPISSSQTLDKNQDTQVPSLDYNDLLDLPVTQQMQLLSMNQLGYYQNQQQKNPNFRQEDHIQRLLRDQEQQRKEMQQQQLLVRNHLQQNQQMSKFYDNPTSFITMNRAVLNQKGNFYQQQQQQQQQQQLGINMQIQQQFPGNPNINNNNHKVYSNQGYRGKSSPTKPQYLIQSENNLSQLQSEQINKYDSNNSSIQNNYNQGFNPLQKKSPSKQFRVKTHNYQQNGIQLHSNNDKNYESSYTGSPTKNDIKRNLIQSQQNKKNQNNIQEQMIIDQIILNCISEKYIYHNEEQLKMIEEQEKIVNKQQLMSQQSNGNSPLKKVRQFNQSSPYKQSSLANIEVNDLLKNINQNQIELKQQKSPTQARKLKKGNTQSSSTLQEFSSQINVQNNNQNDADIEEDDDDISIQSDSDSDSGEDGEGEVTKNDSDYENEQSVKKQVTQPTKQINKISQQSTQDSNQISTKLKQKPTAKHGQLTLLKSVYKGRPSTVFFPYPYFCDKTRDTSRIEKLSNENLIQYNMTYKVMNFTMVQSMSNIFQLAGFLEVDDDEEWNIQWGIGQQKKVKSMIKYQKTNHFPGCYNLGRKDFLWRHLSKSKRKFPKDYNFVPNTYILSSTADWDKFLSEKQQADKTNLWIMKPCGSAQGKGIKILSKKSKVKKSSDYLICEYVANPHLINGLKYDLRIYVCVTSYNPLRIYVFEEGLVRFASEKYSTNLSQLQKKYVHLTNYAINKMNKQKFVQNKDPEKDNIGNKWSLAALKRHYKEQNLDSDGLFLDINDLIVKTCIACEPYMSDIFLQSSEHRKNCFECYGFDILVDDKLKPWLLEVNVQPSLRSSSPLDRRIKHTLVADLFNLIGITPYDKYKLDQDLKKKIPGTQKGESFKSRNIADIKDLNADNCIQKLIIDDWNVLFETDEEYYRRGGFQRIFPFQGNIQLTQLDIQITNDYYIQFFEFQRYYNIIVNQWVKSKVNFLEKVLKKEENPKIC